MAYERVKGMAFRQKRTLFEKSGRPYTMEDDKLVSSRVPPSHQRCITDPNSQFCFVVKRYVHIGFRSQQNLRVGHNLSVPSRQSANPGTLKSNHRSPPHSRGQKKKQTPLTFILPFPPHQNNATAILYPDIPTCIKQTYSESGIRGFYRGLATNLVRVLPGTCVTFVVYENIAWLLRRAAIRRDTP